MKFSLKEMKNIIKIVKTLAKECPELNYEILLKSFVSEFKSYNIDNK